MSVPKKSLISNRVAVKKALIASQPAEFEQENPLKANSLTAQSMKKKRVMNSFRTFKNSSFRTI
ncbi:MAG TPA: hypothetical protein VEI49_04025 [Terriglobales bacterium]|nr:hypothetical protein [Terriglobales bacterium]